MAIVHAVLLDVPEDKARKCCEFIGAELCTIVGGSSAVCIVSTDDADFHEVAEDIKRSVEGAKLH